MKALIGCGTVIGIMLLLVLMIGGGIYDKVVSLRNANEDCNGGYSGGGGGGFGGGSCGGGGAGR